MKNVMPFLLSGILLLSACKKEEEAACPPTEYKSYHPMTIGSYWVYETFVVDTNGMETKTEYDSIIITRDTVINDETFAVIEGTYGPFHQQWGIVRMIREENGEIFNENGDILFSSTNFSDTLKERIEFLPNGDTLYYALQMMQDPQQPVTVPAGTFDVLDAQVTYYTPYTSPGVPSIRPAHNHHAENIGKVFENYFYLSSPNDIQIRLVRYHIED